MRWGNGDGEGASDFYFLWKRIQKLSTGVEFFVSQRVVTAIKEVEFVC